MIFDEFVCRRAIQENLAAEDKESVIRELVSALLDAGAIDARWELEIIESLLSREKLGSTGIGRGVGIPHVKHEAVTRTVAALGVSPQGVDFDSLDGEKAFVFFLLISPPDKAGEHLRALECISDSLRNDTLRRHLMRARSVEEIEELLDDADVGELVGVN